MTMTGRNAGSSQRRTDRIWVALMEMQPRVAPLPDTCNQMPPSWILGSGRFRSSGLRPATRLKLIADPIVEHVRRGGCEPPTVVVVRQTGACRRGKLSAGVGESEPADR